MKKIAFYVEGQTEQLFIYKLLIEVIGQKKIDVKLLKFNGKGKSPIEVHPEKKNRETHNPKHFVLIYDCSGDNGVISRIKEDYARLIGNGYERIIGLHDLYPKSLVDLEKILKIYREGVNRNNKIIVPPLDPNAKIIVAIREIEDWFIKENKHFLNIDRNLTNELILEKLGIDLSQEDLTTSTSSAASDLNEIYSLVGKAYKKDKKRVERTVDCLDYAELYLDISNKSSDLGLLIKEVDAFLHR